MTEGIPLVRASTEHKLNAEYAIQTAAEEFIAHYNIRDLIHQIMILQDHLLHLEDRRVGFSYFF